MAVPAMALALMAVAGCDQVPRTAQAVAQPVQAESPALPAPVFDELDADGLRARAEAALRAQRIHAPAGDSAVDFYLALRERSPDGAGVGAALTELQPYVLIAAEQALGREDLDETRRLLALLARMEADAPALPRLREGLRLAQERADRAEGARLQEPARRPDIPTVAATVQGPSRRATAATTAVPVATPPAATAMPAELPVAPPSQAVLVDAASAPTVREAPQALPRLLVDAPPRYPLAARNRRIEGSVQVAFTIQPDGSVSDARPLSSQPAGVFEDAALAAAARWRFEATGRTVRTTRTLTFRLSADARG